MEKRKSIPYIIYKWKAAGEKIKVNVRIENRILNQLLHKLKHKHKHNTVVIFKLVYFSVAFVFVFDFSIIFKHQLYQRRRRWWWCSSMFIACVKFGVILDAPSKSIRHTYFRFFYFLFKDKSGTEHESNQK